VRGTQFGKFVRVESIVRHGGSSTKLLAGLPAADSTDISHETRMLHPTSDRSWIFVVGCYNSGTTLLERILHRHPDIAGLPGEGQFLSDALVTPRDAGVPRLWAQKEPLFRFAPDARVAEGARLRADWEAQLDHTSAPFAIEKSPTNAARTIWIQRHFPGCAFIHIVRNGYAAAMGIHDKVAQKFGERPNLLEKAAYQWVRTLEVLADDRPALQKLIEIRYEDLVIEPTQTINLLLNFLGLPERGERLVSPDYLIHGVRAPISNHNATRICRMTPNQIQIVSAIASPWLDRYGYTPDFN
jgi:hypothetical protein